MSCLAALFDVWLPVVGEEVELVLAPLDELTQLRPFLATVHVVIHKHHHLKSHKHSLNTPKNLIYIQVSKEKLCLQLSRINIKYYDKKEIKPYRHLFKFATVQITVKTT